MQCPLVSNSKLPIVMTGFGSDRRFSAAISMLETSGQTW
jgi:hypothetical protein